MPKGTEQEWEKAGVRWGRFFNLRRRGLETGGRFSLAISRLRKELGRVSNFNQSII